MFLFPAVGGGDEIPREYRLQTPGMAGAIKKVLNGGFAGGPEDN